MTYLRFLRARFGGRTEPTTGGRALVALAIAWCSVVAGEREAGAFCRSTTCSGECARDENGCKTTGEKLFWASKCVGFSVQEDGTENLPMEQVRPVIEQGFLAWTDLPCDVGAASIAFAPLDDVACRKAEYNPDGANANVVLFQDTKWDYAGAENNLAKTTVTYDKETGEIFDADIEINFAFNELTVGDDAIAFDLGSLVTHEIGHFIGLDHTPDPLATMSEGYEEGSSIQRTLEDDDLAGVCAAYPPGRDAICAPQPRNGLGDRCAGEDEEMGDSGGCAAANGGSRDGGPSLPRGGAGALLCVAAVLWATRARRSRRRSGN